MRTMAVIDGAGRKVFFHERADGIHFAEKQRGGMLYTLSELKEYHPGCKVYEVSLSMRVESPEIVDREDRRYYKVAS